jgi:hypothetical protein
VPRNDRASSPFGFNPRGISGDKWPPGPAPTAKILPSPPLVSGILPNVLALPLARLEPYGMMILIVVLLILPLIGAQVGLDFRIVSHVIAAVTDKVMAAILFVTGNT